MTDEELERMRNYAKAAREHPPKLLAALDMHRAGAKQRAERELRLENEVRGLAEANERLKTRERQWPDAWHRLRFAEMVLDRVGAEIDGVPWREAARLSESLDGEPVTEPVAPKEPDVTLGVGSGSGDGRDGMFVHGTYEAISSVRQRLDKLRRLESWLTEIDSQVRVAPASDPGVKSGD